MRQYQKMLSNGEYENFFRAFNKHELLSLSERVTVRDRNDEKFYQMALVFVLRCVLGTEFVTPEGATAQGYLDIGVELPKECVIIETKVLNANTTKPVWEGKKYDSKTRLDEMSKRYSEMAKVAMDQIATKNYERFHLFAKDKPKVHIAIVADGYKRHLAWATIKRGEQKRDLMLLEGVTNV